MEHEFVPGKRRCVHCRLKLNEAAWLDSDRADVGLPPEGCPNVADRAPEPEKPPQTWHLNVWTDIGTARFAVSKAISQTEADALSWRFRLMEEGKGPADEPLDGVETALVNSLIQLISEIRANKPTEETE